MSHADRIQERERMLRTQIMARGVCSVGVLEAMRTIPRELFLPPEFQAEAYADNAQPIGQGQTISQPYIVALMTEAMALTPRDKVLEIGTGSGYQTAILAQLAGRVYTVERVATLLEEARRRLVRLGVGNVEYRVGDGTLGWPECAPFDRILITAAGPGLPTHLLQTQLRDGGIAVLPAGGEDWQTLWRVTRRGQRLEREDLGACRFVRLLGAEGWQDQDEERVDA